MSKGVGRVAPRLPGLRDAGLNWAPLSAWVGAVASDDDAIEDAAGDDAAMRKAKTLARLRKAF